MNEKTTVGIDPGVSGGIAIFQNGAIELRPMPDPYTDVVSLFKCLPDDTEVFLEQINGFMGGRLPASRVGVLMENYGFLQGALFTCGLRVVKVVPAKWQQAIGCGTRPKQMPKHQWKAKIKGIVSQKHPTLKITLATSDALGILEYALNHTHKNGTV